MSSPSNGPRPAPDGDPDALLMAVMLGEVERSDPRVLERAAHDPEFASTLKDVEEVGRTLDRAGTEEREILAIATRAKPARQPRAMIPLLLVAAAAAAAVLLWLRPWEPGAPPSNPYAELSNRLLAASDFELHIEGDPGHRVLRWDIDAGLGWFDLVVFEIAADERRTEVWRQPDLETSEFPLDPSPWPPSNLPHLLVVEQHVDGVAGAWKQGSLLYLPQD